MTNRKSAVITGASGGIGLDLAHLFARDGWDVFLVARSEDKLRSIAAEIERAHSVKATVIAVDLARPEAPETVLGAVGTTPVDALVNNAGFGLSGRFDELDLQRELSMIQLNVVALTHLTGLFLPRMVARGSGHVMNVASLAGFVPGPYMAIYYATKAFVVSFSEAIAEELSGTGVTVTALCPGPTQTGFAEAADMTKANLFKLQRPMASADVARVGYEGMKRGKRVIFPGAMTKLSAVSAKVTPRPLSAKITKMLNR